MNRILRYIYKNFSVFNGVGFIILTAVIVNSITMESQESYHGMAGALLIVLFLSALPFFLFDLLMKKIIPNRILLNFMQSLIVLVLCLIFYFKYL